MLTRLFDGAIEQVTRGLAYATRRHDVLSQNVANLETPGYQAKDVVFDDYLKPMLRVVTSGDAPELLPVGPAERRPRLVMAADGQAKPNGNDVDMDHQMSRVAENTLFHNALTQILAGQFNALKQAISGRV
jgi:flagellar basal-body rod protein FlgB